MDARKASHSSLTPFLRKASSTSSEDGCMDNGHTYRKQLPDPIPELVHKEEYSSNPTMFRQSSDHSTNSSSSGQSQTPLKGEIRRTRSRRKSRCCSLCPYIISFILFLFVVALGFFVYQFYRELVQLRQHVQMLEASQPDIVQRGVCLPCTLLRMGSPEENEALMGLERYPRELRSGETKPLVEGEECCAKDRGQFETLIHTFVERRIREEKATDGMRHPCSQPLVQNNETSVPVAPCSGRGANTSVVAHLVAKEPPKSRDKKHQEPEGQMQIKHWDISLNSKHNTYMSHLDYRYGRLIIQEPGLYFIYSQVHFVEYFEPVPEGTQHHSSSFSHYVYKYNAILPNGGDELMLHHSQSPCWSANKDLHEHTSFVGGIFKLKAQDEIFIKVSNLSAVHTAAESTYFGLYQIGV